MVNFPPNAGAQRDQLILSAVKNNQAQISWATITSSIPGHTAEFRVFADALKISNERVLVSANLQQSLADVLNCSLLTAKLADLLFVQRKWALLPHPQAANSGMASTQAMESESSWIDQQLAALGYNNTGIVQTVGKHWILDNLLQQHPGKAINYGWHFQGTFQNKTWSAPSGKAAGPTTRVIQPASWAHDALEEDYSQNCVLVARTCRVDGYQADLLQVLQDPQLAGLANYDGVLRVLRMPGTQPQVASFNPPCIGDNCPEDVVWNESGDATTRTSSTGLAYQFAVGVLGAVGGFLLGKSLWGGRRVRHGLRQA